MNFDAFIKDITEKKLEVYGVEVYKDGELLHSYGDTKKNIYDIYSATKSVLSIAVGIACDRGLFDINKTILDYLPISIISKMNIEQKKTLAALPITRFLTMSVGDIPFQHEGEDWLLFDLSCKINNPEERLFNYSNCSAYLVGAALHYSLKGKINQDLGEFIEENIFEPLEITNYEYGRSPEGIFYGASKMKMSVNELSRIGELVYNYGLFKGKRIVSEKYIKTATSVQQMNREGGYGYFFWKYKDGFSINGKWGQKCYCIPQQGIMITFLSHIENGSELVKGSMEKYLL